jgi:hypothetical protein
MTALPGWLTVGDHAARFSRDAGMNLLPHI